MNTKQQAAEELRKFSVKLKGILAIGEDLEKAGSLEQAIAESESRLSILAAKEADSQARIAKAEAAITDALDKAKGMEAFSKAKIQEALNEAKDIKERAQGSAKEIIAKAEARVRDIEVQASRKNADLEVLAVTTKERQKYLDSLNREIASVKEKFA